MARVSERIPVTLDAAEKLPIRSGRCRYWMRFSSSRARLTCPSESSSITTTSVMDSRHDSSFEWCSNGPMKTTGPLLLGDVRREVVAVVEVGGDAQVEDADELVDGAGAARAAEEHEGVVVGPDGVVDDAAGVLTQPGGLQAGAGALGVGVCVPGQDLVPDEVLDEAEGAAGGRVVGVGHPAGAVGAVHDLVVTDDRRRIFSISGEGVTDIGTLAVSLAWYPRVEPMATLRTVRATRPWPSRRRAPLARLLVGLATPPLEPRAPISTLAVGLQQLVLEAFEHAIHPP